MRNSTLMRSPLGPTRLPSLMAYPAACRSAAALRRRLPSWLHPPVAQCREIIACRPGARGELLAEQVILRRERLEPDFAISVIFVAQEVEIARAPRYRKVGAPPVLDALEFDEASRLEPAYLVR